tara:strand:+ start:10440 stop:13574 length:3135 start_codon:yes stop_codon:yes gene_type:complete
MGQLHYSSNFVTNYDQTYILEIRSKLDNTGTDIDFDLTSEGFKIKWDQGNNLRLSELMPSTLTFGFIIQSNAERDFVKNVLQSSRGNWYIRIKKNGSGDVYWGGWIEPGFDNYEDVSYPYTIKIRATDSLDVVIDKYTQISNINPAQNFKDLRYPLRVFKDKYDIAEVFPINKWNFAFNWYNNQSAGVPSSSNDPAQETFYNRQAFVDSPVDFPNIIRDIYSEIRGVYKAMSCRVFFSAGQYRVIQDNTYKYNHPEWIYLDPTTTTPLTYNSSVYNGVLVDNNDLGLINARVLAGGTHTFDPELNSVRANFVFDDAGVIFDPSANYVNLTTIGFLGGGTASMLLNLNLQSTQQHLMPNPLGPFQPLPDNPQGLATSTRYTCTFKSGSYYLKCNIYLAFFDQGSVNVQDFEWTQDPNNRVIIIGTAQTAFNTAFFTYAYPNATTITKGYFTNLEIPQPPFYGELQFKFEAEISFLNDIPNAVIQDSYDDIITTLAQWWNGNPPVSQTQSINGMPQLGGAMQVINPCALSYASSSQTNQGAIYMAQQNPSVTNPDFNLGDVKLGTVLGQSDTIKTLAYDNSGVYTPITGMYNLVSGGTTTPISPTRLLVRQYLQGQSEPVNIFQGTIESTAYEAHKFLLMPEYIDGNTKQWIFLGGTYTAATDQWSGSWYKLNINDTDTLDETELVDNNPDAPFDPGPIGVGGHGSGESFPTKIPGKNNLRENINNVTSPVLALIQSNSIGQTTNVIPAAVYNNGDEFDIDPIKCDLKINQKIMLCDNNGGNFTYLETYLAKTAGSNKISIKAKTLARDYPIGSIIMIQSNDLTNVITGGSGGVSQIVAGTNVTISPSGGTGVVTVNSTGGGTPASPTNSVQFNDGGNFGGESAFRYLKNSNNLFVTNTNSHFFGTNIGHRSYFDPNLDELWFFLTAQDFDLGDTSRYFIYSRDGSDTVMNGFDSRAPMRIASTYLPIGYRLVAYEVYTNAARPLYLKTSTFDSTNSNLLDAGTTNAINPLSTPYTTSPGEYFSLLVQADRSTTQVLGGRLRLQKL